MGQVKPIQQMSGSVNPFNILEKPDEVHLTVFFEWYRIFKLKQKSTDKNRKQK